MKIAVTRLAGKEKDDISRCARYGHVCYSVYPLRSCIHSEEIAAFIRAVDSNAFDCLFFTSALPAKLVAPLLKKIPRIVSIGPQTARELEHHGIRSEILTTYYSRDFVPFLGEWIRGRHIGIPRADVPNPALISSIVAAGGIPHEFRCYSLEPTGTVLDTEGADAILFTSTMSFTNAIWEPHPGLLVLAIGEITAAAMQKAGVFPAVTGDGSLEGSLRALNACTDGNEGG